MKTEERPFNKWAQNLQQQLNLIHQQRRQQSEQNFKLLLGKTYGQSSKRN